MKISEQSILTNNQISSAHPQDTQGFEQWLKTPAKESSGDEYYWQHQEQLQQSCLHFDSVPQVKKPKADEMAETNTSKLESESHLSANNPSIIAPALCPPVQNINIPSSSAKELTQVIIDPEIELTQNITPSSTNDRLLTREKEVSSEQVNNSLTPQINQSEFKNHHLFVADQLVELTLNSQDFNPEEERDLIHMMKHHLKEKGLSLSRLIINGVEND